MTLRAWLGPLVATVRETSEEADRPVQLMSKFSNTVSFNTLQIPNLVVTGDYNYYDERELDVHFNESKEQQQWAQAPMYVKLEWQPVKKLELAAAGPQSYHGIPVKGLPPLGSVQVVNPEVSQNPLIIIKR